MGLDSQNASVLDPLDDFRDQIFMVLFSKFFFEISWELSDHMKTGMSDFRMVIFDVIDHLFDRALDNAQIIDKISNLT